MNVTSRERGILRSLLTYTLFYAGGAQAYAFGGWRGAAIAGVAVIGVGELLWRHSPVRQTGRGTDRTLVRSRTGTGPQA